MRILFLSTTTLIILFFLSISSCKKSKTSDAPAIPSESTMNMDFGFTGSTKAVKATADSLSNFKTASSIVAFWALAAKAVTLIPATAFKAIINGTTATYDEETNKWTWIKSFKIVDQQYYATLSGAIAGDSVTWEMNIQKFGDSNVYKYFEGVSYKSNGWWKLYKRTGVDATMTQEALIITWRKNVDDVNYIRYTNTNVNDNNYGSYISFRKTQDIGTPDRYFAAKIMISDNVDINGKAYIIEWYSKTHEGDLKWDTGQSTLSQLCWDTKLKNVVCK